MFSSGQRSFTWKPYRQNGGSGLSVALSSESLLELAKSRAPADRERLLLGIVDLCETSDPGEVAASAQIQALLNSIFLGLVVGAERDIRRRLSGKLATADWCPSALVNVLALDEIEIARPIIAASPVLKEADLVRLLVEATIEHQIEVARRPNLAASVVAEIVRKAEPAVLTALAANVTADIAEDDMLRLVEQARQVAALRTPLTAHPKLTDDLALRLYIWVGQTLRDALADRFRLDPTRMMMALAEAVAEAHSTPAGGQGVVVLTRDGEREAMEGRLIEKLHAADQLRPGYLVRVLQEGRLSLFVAALATLGRFETEQVRRTIDSDRPELLGLACAAVGIDRSVFPTILELVRKLNGGLPSGGAEGARRAAGAFAPVTPDIAGAAFRQAVKSV
jgi:uncharacterized protein (DUF2336 family)